MKNKFIVVVVGAGIVGWMGFMVYLTNEAYPHPGAWQFFVGMGFTAVIAFGIVALFTEEKP